MTTSIVDNGVNVEALLGAREAFADTPEIAQFQWRSTRVLGQRHAQPRRGRDVLRLRRGAAAPDDVRLRHRPPAAVRRAGQRHHAGGVRAGRARRLPDRGHRRGRPAAGDPAALGAGHASPRRWTCTASSAPTRTCATASAGSASTTRSTPTRRRAEIEALVAQSQKRSAVYDILTNPTAVTVTVDAGDAMRHTTTVVVGAGHCGLAMSRCLAERSIDHVVLERGEVAHSWRTQRWDSLRLLTPNWMTRLPGLRLPRRRPGRLPRRARGGPADRGLRRGVGGAGADRHHRHLGPARRPTATWCAPTGAPGTRGRSCVATGAAAVAAVPARLAPGARRDHHADRRGLPQPRPAAGRAACWSSAPRRAGSRSPRSCSAPGGR